MILIFSGVDKVGKTTLAKKVVNATNGCYVKFEGPTDMNSDKFNVKAWARQSKIFHESILRYLEATKQFGKDDFIVIDRFHPDETVYSKVMRDCDVSGFYSHLDTRFARLDVVFVYVKPKSIDLLRTRWLEEKLIPFEQVEQLMEGFDEFYRDTKMNKISVTEDTEAMDIVRFCMKCK